MYANLVLHPLSVVAEVLITIFTRRFCSITTVAYIIVLVYSYYILCIVYNINKIFENEMVGGAPKSLGIENFQRIRYIETRVTPLIAVMNDQK